MFSKIIVTLIIILGTIIEIALLWDPHIFSSNEILRYAMGIIVALDIIALIKILMNI